MGADSAIGERLEWSGKINCVIKRIFEFPHSTLPLV